MSPTNQLDTFCRSLLALLEARADEPALLNLYQELSGRIGTAVADLAERVQEEATAREAVIRSLAALPSRYLVLPSGVATIRTELEASRDAAVELVAALQALAAPPDRASPRPVKAAETPRPAAAPRREPPRSTPIEPLPLVYEQKPLPVARVSPPPEPAPVTRPEAESKPARVPAAQVNKIEVAVTVKCPRCERAGEIPWNRLDKVFVCPGCKGRFGVNNDGKAVELVARSEGKWVESSRHRQQQKDRWKRKMLFATVAAALFVPAIALGGWHATRSAKPPAERELPRELTARAELFVQAWLCNDTRLMQRLASPSADKLVYSWYSRHKPPPALRSATDGTPPEGVRLDTAVQSAKPGQSTTKVKVVKEGAMSELTLTWEQRGEDWFFLPPAR
jgi:hypothetical protein